MNDESRPPEAEPTPISGSGTEPSRGSSVRAQQSRANRDPGNGTGHVLGTRIGGYLLRECIGQGGMARIYRAEHEGLQRQVALKVLLDTPGGAGDGHERFLREARIAAAIKHRNVVNIFDVGVDRGTPFLAMELLEGADLDTFMGGKNRLDEATTMEIVVPIASALATVHDAGIVHRDLKPGNIFLSRGRNDELEPRLLDFGISKSVTDQLRLTSAQGPVLGTPFYMSPEAAAGADMTALSDQYALGVVLYECLTGVHPFAASSNFAEIVRRISVGDYVPISLQNPQLSKRMAAIVERAMHLDPARRFANMRALGRELLLLAGQRTRVTWQLSFDDLPARAELVKTSALRTTPMPMVRRTRRRRSYVLPALLALFALLGTLAWTAARVEPYRTRVASYRGLGESWLASTWRHLRSVRGIDTEVATVDASRESPAAVSLALRPANERSARPESIRAAIAAPASETETGLASPGAVSGASNPPDLPGIGEAPALPSPGSRLGAADPAAPAGAHPTSLAVSQALRGPTRSRGAPQRRASKASKSSTQPQASPPLEYGTNHAPILD